MTMTDVLVRTVRLKIPDYNALLKASEDWNESIDDFVQAAVDLAFMDARNEGMARLGKAAQAVRLAREPKRDSPPEPRSRW